MRIKGIVFFILVSVFTSLQDLHADNFKREKININREWKFQIGDFPEAETELYDDKGWSNINLPHNFSTPYFQSAQWYTGYGWYRKHFNVPAQWKAKRIFIEFEGAFRDAQIFLNAIHIVFSHMAHPDFGSHID